MLTCSGSIPRSAKIPCPPYPPPQRKRICSKCAYLEYCFFGEPEQEVGGTGEIEGKLTKTEMARIKARLKYLIKADHDNVLFYTVKAKKWMSFHSMGTVRAETSNIL